MTKRPGDPDATGNWLDLPDHRAYLTEDARKALDFFDASVNPSGGFHVLDFVGDPLPGGVQELHTTTRLVHSYALGVMAGRPDAANVIDRGMSDLWNRHRDERNGGYFWSLHGDDVADGTKLAYGHVFTLLAASSAKMVGHPDADRLLADISAVLDQHYWDEARGLFRDEFTREWQVFSQYRGMNANMHGTEALLTAFEATGNPLFLNRAERILRFFVDEQAARNNWRIPEHYTADWQADHQYAGNPMFRPAGTTPGHSFEMARLLLQWWGLSGRPSGDASAHARQLIEQALTDAWNEERGGFAYTLHFDGKVDQAARYWWPVTEAIGAVAALIKQQAGPDDEKWYRRLWQFADSHLTDHDNGGWFPELDRDNQPVSVQFLGKPDIYHALQADLLPLAPGLSYAGEGLQQLQPLK